MEMTMIGTVLGLLLLAVPLYVFAALKVKILRLAATAIVRMLVQLALTGMYMHWMFRFNHVVLNVLWLVVMTFTAAWMVARQGKLRRTRMLLPVWGSLLASVLLVGMYVLFLVVRPGNVWDARWLVPIAGILLAGCVNVNAVALREYFVGLVRFSDTYYYKVGNGATWLQAVAPIVKRALERAYLPALAHLSALGIVLIPFMLSGMLVAGFQPWESVALTAVMVAAILCTSVASLLITIVVSHRKVIDKRGKLADLVRIKPHGVDMNQPD